MDGYQQFSEDRKYRLASGTEDNFLFLTGVLTNSEMRIF
jgi:hypothetical protein